MMEARFVILFCVLATANAANPSANPPTITLGFDRPSLRLTVLEKASFQCCYKYQYDVKVEWLLHIITNNSSKQLYLDVLNERMKFSNKIRENNFQCSNLMLKDIELNDTGLYLCKLKHSDTIVYTPGTFLQVYVPIKKILNINERSKNSIITAQGVFLMLFVLLPGTMLICKTKGLKELQNRKGIEEENIYEGLNLDDCNSTYHQIQRSLVQGPYQDVINNDEEDIQLEKP